MVYSKAQLWILAWSVMFLSHLAWADLEKVNLNLLTPEQIQRYDFTHKDFSITTMPLKHLGIFKDKTLKYSRLGIDLSNSGIEEAHSLKGVDFTGSTNAPEGMVKGKWLNRAKLAGLDLTHIGAKDAKSLEEVDFTGSINAPEGMAKGQLIKGAKLTGMDLFKIGLHEARNIAENIILSGPVSVSEDAYFPGFITWSSDPGRPAQISYRGSTLSLDQFQRLQSLWYHLIHDRGISKDDLPKIIDRLFKEHSLEDILKMTAEERKQAAKLTLRKLQSKNIFLIVNPVSDPNMAFRNGDEAFNKVAKSQNYEVDEFKALSPKEVLVAIKQYPEKSIAHVVLRGHGNSTTLVFGNGQKDKISIDWERRDDAALFFEELGKKMKTAPGYHPTVLLHSCSTGLPNREGESLGLLASVMMPGVAVFAPDQDITQLQLGVEKLTENSVKYQHPSLKVFYNGMQVSSENLNKKILQAEIAQNEIPAEKLGEESKKVLAELTSKLKDGGVTAGKLDELMNQIQDKNIRERLKRTGVALLQHYQKRDDTQSLCQNLIDSCPLGFCDGGYLYKFNQLLNEVMEFDGIQNQVIATQEQFKDHNVSHLTWSKDLIQQLCQQAHCSKDDLEWHLKGVKEENQVHYLKAVKEVFSKELGYDRPKDLGEIDKTIIQSLFQSEANRKLFLETFMRNHVEYLVDFYQNQVEKWIQKKPNRLIEMKNVIQQSKRTDNTFCRKHEAYLFNEMITQPTRGGIYCLLLATGLIDLPGMEKPIASPADK